MTLGKGEYLKRLTRSLRFRTPKVERELQGSTPPSVFIGSWNYPKVFAGPLITPLEGDTRFMDMPEEWIPSRRTQEEIVTYRISLIRGKQVLDAARPEDRRAEALREIALSEASLGSEASFRSPPSGFSISEEHAPHGPSGMLESFHAEEGRWNRELERVHGDTDLTAGEAILHLHLRGVPFSSIQKALSVGALGSGRKRRLVPTRWSITACDTTIGDALLEKVRNLPPIDTIRVHEFSSLHNRYLVLLLPGAWRYEWIESFLQGSGREGAIFSDFEEYRGRDGYSSVGGCFYSCRMAVLEALWREQRQAEAIILREAYPDYIPLGVFNVRENVKHAMHANPVTFEEIPSALGYVSSRLQLPFRRYVQEGRLLREVLKGGQTTLSRFMYARPREAPSGGAALQVRTTADSGPEDALAHRKSA